jgi:S1-C subfamily serine protease
LVDSNGNLLGVINFIESTTGGNQGLNFAIPIDVVSESYSKILKETKR